MARIPPLSPTEVERSGEESGGSAWREVGSEVGRDAGSEVGREVGSEMEAGSQGPPERFGS